MSRQPRRLRSLDPVGTLVGLMASAYTPAEILEAYLYLEEADIYEALAYAAWRAEESV